MKRSHPGAGNTGRDRKRQKMRSARHIPVEDVNKQNLTGSSSALPPSLDVDKFVSARSFELDALEKSMLNAKGAGNTRAFQSLPRHLRRRAASHNVRRLPLRLRAKARLEIANDKLKHKRRKFRDIPWTKRRKLLCMSRAQILHIRARKKGWLETHVWHAKRMKMVNKWNSRIVSLLLPLRSYRPSYRASMHGCLLHDASYHVTFALSGPESSLIKCLTEMVDPTDISPCAPRFRSGARVADAVLYEGRDGLSQWPRGMICPAKVIWEAEPGSSKNQISETGCSKALDEQRHLWIIVHPAAAATVHSRIKVVRQVREETIGVVRLDHRDFNIFQLHGPKSSAILGSVLKPASALKPSKAHLLKHLSTSSPSALPDGIVAHLEVSNPRENFPPKMPSAPAQHGSPVNPPHPSRELVQSKEKSLFQLALLDHQDPLQAYRKPSHARDCNPENTKNTDSSVPIMIFKHSTGSSALQASSRSHDTDNTQGLTLMLPKRQAMPFWMSMVYCAPRVGGLDQQAQLQRESGSLSYPRDYQWTQVGRQELSMAARPAEEKWTRTPTAKRVNFEANGTISAFYPLWKSLSNSDEAPEDDTRHLWLVKGSLLQSIVESADPPQYTLTQQTTKALSKRSIKPFGRLPSLSHAVVSVRIIACSGGLPETNAALYGLQNSDYSDATESAKIRIQQIGAVAGWVTSGGYSLGRGGGFGIGSLRFDVAHECFRQNSSSPSTPRLLFKNPSQKLARLAKVELLL